MLIITLPYGLYVMMIGRCINTVICMFLNARPNKKLLNYSIIEQIKDILPSLLLSVVMCAIVLCINLLQLNPFVTIIIQVITGAMVYILGAKILKIETFAYVLNIVKSIVKKKKA